MDLSEIKRRLSVVEPPLAGLGLSLNESLESWNRLPAATCIHTGVVIEHLLRDLWRRLELKGSPERRQLEDLLTGTTRKLEEDHTPIPRRIYDYIRTLQLTRNRAAHHWEASSEDALDCLWRLAEVAHWYFVTFLPTRYPAPGADSTAVTSAEMSAAPEVIPSIVETTPSLGRPNSVQPDERDKSGKVANTPIPAVEKSVDEFAEYTSSLGVAKVPAPNVENTAPKKDAPSSSPTRPPTDSRLTTERPLPGPDQVLSNLALPVVSSRAKKLLVFTVNAGIAGGTVGALAALFLTQVLERKATHFQLERLFGLRILFGIVVGTIAGMVAGPIGHGLARNGHSSTTRALVGLLLAISLWLIFFLAWIVGSPYLPSFTTPSARDLGRTQRWFGPDSSDLVQTSEDTDEPALGRGSLPVLTDNFLVCSGLILLLSQVIVGVAGGAVSSLRWGRNGGAIARVVCGGGLAGAFALGILFALTDQQRACVGVMIGCLVGAFLGAVGGAMGVRMAQAGVTARKRAILGAALGFGVPFILLSAIGLMADRLELWSRMASVLALTLAITLGLFGAGLEPPLEAEP